MTKTWDEWREEKRRREAALPRCDLCHQQIWPTEQYIHEKTEDGLDIYYCEACMTEYNGYINASLLRQAGSTATAEVQP